MGDAYTPGLTVTGATVVRKTRRLPLQGEVIVSVGDRVRASDVVASTKLPGRVHLLNFANKLGVMPDELPGYLSRAPGDGIQRGAVVAERRSFFGLLKETIESPIDGTLESVSTITGQAVLREPPTAVELRAYIDGEVVAVHPGEGVDIATQAALVQGIFGLSGETHAPISVVAKGPDHVVAAADLRDSYSGRIVVCGARISLAAFARAMDLGVAGVVAGGINYQDVKDLLGYDVGVAVTGTEALPTTLVITEGFGDIAMARPTYDLLARHDGCEASITGATQIRAGVIRPEVVIPHGGDSKHGSPPEAGALELGAPVRCIRAPYFGEIGHVAALPVDLHTMPSETHVRVVEVALGGGGSVVVPRANVEVIEG